MYTEPQQLTAWVLMAVTEVINNFETSVVVLELEASFIWPFMELLLSLFSALEGLCSLNEAFHGYLRIYIVCHD